MASAEDEKAFLRAAIDALPRVAEIVSRFPPGDQPEAFDAAQRHFVEAARNYGCAEMSAQFRVSAIMRLLRRKVKARHTNNAKLRALLRRLTEPMD